MDNNALKAEANLNFAINKNQNENQALIVAEKFKNSGTITITQIFESGKTDIEKLNSLASEYIKLQSDFSQSKQEFLNYISKQNWNEIPVIFEQVAHLAKLSDERNIKYKIQYNNANFPSFLVYAEDEENSKKFNKLFSDFRAGKIGY